MWCGVLSNFKFQFKRNSPWRDLVLTKKVSIKENDIDRIICNFKKTKFTCIRCGSTDIEITGVKPYSGGINKHGIYRFQTIGDDETFYITSLLDCRNCKHRFYMNMLDQGIRNTDVYFDNTLEQRDELFPSNQSNNIRL